MTTSTLSAPVTTPQDQQLTKGRKSNISYTRIAVIGLLLGVFYTLGAAIIASNMVSNGMCTAAEFSIK